MVERVHDHDLCAEQSRNLNRAAQARIDGFAVGGLVRPELICEGEGRMRLIGIPTASAVLRISSAFAR